MTTKITCKNGVMMLTDEMGTLFVAEGRYSPWPQKMIYPPNLNKIREWKDAGLTRALERLGYGR